MRVPVIKELAKSFDQTQTIPFKANVELVDRLFERQIREEILFGLFLGETIARLEKRIVWLKVAPIVDLVSFKHIAYLLNEG